MRDDRLFEKANAAIKIDDLVVAAGGKLWGSGRVRRGICPLRQCGKVHGARPFRCEPDEGKWWCYSCAKGGDVVELEQLLGGGSPLEAANRLLGRDYTPPPPRKPRNENEEAADERRRREYAQQVWGGSQPILGGLVEKYLLSRDIHPAVIVAASARLRFHPAVRQMWSEQLNQWVRGPAMVARTETVEGPTGGIHATFILPDGTGRDKVLGKVMWGPQMGPRRGDVLYRSPGGTWLIGEVLEGYDDTPLVIGEGIETVLSLASIAWAQGRRVRAAAALSLDRLQGRALKDKQQCVDLAKITMDPAWPAFTWPQPVLQPWPEVLVAIDHDMKPVDVQARTPRGKITPFRLDGEGRAALCARLVRQQWKAVGQDIRPCLPPLNSDWNDELRRRVRKELAREGVSA